MKPKRAFISFIDKQVHAEERKTTFFRIAACGTEVLERDTIPHELFRVGLGGPLCAGCVENIEASTKLGREMVKS